MNRRKFIKNGSVLGATLSISSLAGVANAKIDGKNDIDGIRKLLKDSKFTSLNGKKSFKVVINNVHSEFYDFKANKNNNLDIISNNIYPFSFPQGDFGLQLRSLTNGFVAMNLFKLNKKGYILVGENIGNTNILSTNKMTWLKHGVRISVSENSISK